MVVDNTKYQRRVCANAMRHTPAPMNLQHHHIQPRSWGGPDVAENIVDICPTCHEGGHTALNAIIYYHKNGMNVPPTVWARFHPYFQWLALDAIRRAGGIKLIYTMAHGAE